MSSGQAHQPRLGPAAVQVRRAGSADVDALHHLIESCFRGDGSRQGWTTEADLLAGPRSDRREITAAVTGPSSSMLCAELSMLPTELDGGAPPGAPSPAAGSGHGAAPAGPAGSDAGGGAPPALVGCVRVERDHREPDAPAHLGMLAVRPEHQGLGIGRILVEAAEQLASRRWGAGELQMLVLAPRTELIAWYERLGYRRTGATVPFREVASDVLLAPDLRFVVLHKQLPARAG
jgi:ribosomal protein S18 acetylase RimI-like enzyme